MAAGSASIGAPANGNLTINQSSNRAIINWNSFSVGAQNSVTFNQPGSSSAVLNRVTGDTTSVIAGKISANGQVFLVNPNGIAITPSGTVEVGGGFVGSSLGIRNRDFMDGNLAFSGKGGAVSNAGSITAGTGGFAALLGGSVSNSGTITVPRGRIGLGAGSRATLDLTGDGFLQIASAGSGGGTVRMTGGQLREAVRNVVNMGGSATTARGTHGRIVLGNGGPRYAASKRIAVADAGAVVNAGRISAEAGHVVLSGKAVTVDKGRISTASPVAKGGSIVLTATDTISLLAASLDASGATGGGSIKVGGDYQGSGTLPRTRTLSVDAGSVIRADATKAGDGGRVILWSDGKTVFNGLISAQGGAQSGNGGFAEVSGKGTLVYTGIANLRAAYGQFGSLLLDPYNITISNAADASSAGFSASGNDSVINVTTLINALNYANVEVKTGAVGSAGAQAGNITLTTPLMWATRATLTLTAANNIALNDKITAPSGRLELNAGGTISATGDILLGTFVLNGGAWTQNTPALPRFEASDFRISGGSFLRATGGDGTTGNPYKLVDVYGLQGMNTFLAGNFALDADIDARGTAKWNPNIVASCCFGFQTGGFTPIGTFNFAASTPFTGSLDGRGHLITGLTTYRLDGTGVGLFGLTSGATLKNFGLENANIRGSDLVGGIVGFMSGGFMTNVYSTGAISGVEGIGGLAGVNRGAISNSYSSASVQGFSNGTANAGGLVGINTSAGTIVNAYALGSVSGNSAVGGLVGVNQGQITSAYASGLVNGFSGIAVGGLVGDGSTGTVTNAVWDKDSTGQTVGIGGLQGTITNLNSVDAGSRYLTASYIGFNFGQDWVSVSADTRPMLRSEYSTTIRNLHQLQLMGMAPSASYTLDADIDASATTGTNSSDIWSSKGFAPMADYLGIFDGKMHVVDKLTINRRQENNISLFGKQNGTVSNLGVTNARINASTFIGIVAGRNSGTIFNVYSTGEVTGDSNVGGLVGQLSTSASSGTIESSYASATVTGNNSSGTGGLVGGADAGTKIKNSYATGAIKTPNVGGGLVGDLFGTIESSYASGSVTGSKNLAGGLVGVLRQSGLITSSYWDTDSTGQNTAAGNVSNAPGATGITAGNRYSKSTYAGFDFTNTWYSADGAMRPILRSEWSTSIHNAHQLQLISTNLSANYTLANTVDAAATAGSNASDVWSRLGFAPIGLGAGFNGSLRGQNYSIDDLTINLPNNAYVGLFGYVGKNGFVSVVLNRPTVTGSSNVGAVVGRNAGSVVASQVSGGRVQGLSSVGGAVGFNESTIIVTSVQGTVVSGFNFVGGMAGANQGTIQGSQSSAAVSGSTNVGGLAGSSLGSIFASFAEGAVQGENTAGGLVGINSGSIETSYASGNVSKLITSQFPGSNFGGLVGSNSGSILNAYATGSVSGGTSIGGLIGQQLGNSVTRNTYATGLVTGTLNVGGLIGQMLGSSLTSSYWDTQTTGQQNAIGSQAGGTVTNVAGYTTAQMQDINTFATIYQGFDFAKVWWPASQGFYPLLYPVSQVVAYAPGTVTTTYGTPQPTFDPKLLGGLLPPRSNGPDGFFVDTSSVTQSAGGYDNAGKYKIPLFGFCGACDGAPFIQGDDGKYYRFVTLPATYIVNPLAVPVTALGGTSTQGQSPANPGLQFGAILPGDNPNLVFGGLLNSFGINSSTPVGFYPLNVLGQSGDPNYSIIRFDGLWSVTPGAVVIPPTGGNPAANTPPSYVPAGTPSAPVCSAMQIVKRLRTTGTAPLFDPWKKQCTEF